MIVYSYVCLPEGMYDGIPPGLPAVVGGFLCLRNGDKKAAVRNLVGEDVTTFCGAPELTIAFS